MERFIDRVARTPHRDRLVLKGAALWQVWGGAAARPTRDLDFLGSGSTDVDDIAAMFSEIVSTPAPDDGVVFPVAELRAAPIRATDIHGGARVRLTALLARARIPVQVDVGFGSAVEPPAIEVEFPALLGGPGPRIVAYRQETAIAEKLEAAVVLAERNSRTKDFYDLCMLPRWFAFEGAVLVSAVAATFVKRGTPYPVTVDDALPTAFFGAARNAADWREYLAANGLRGAPSDFPVIGDEIRAFLGPVLEAAAGRGGTPGRWEPGGPWR